jgi:hypothetical protein
MHAIPRFVSLIFKKIKYFYTSEIIKYNYFKIKRTHTSSFNLLFEIKRTIFILIILLHISHLLNQQGHQLSYYVRSAHIVHRSIE